MLLVLIETAKRLSARLLIAKVEAFRMYLKLGILSPSRLTQQVHLRSKHVIRSWEARVLNIAFKLECLDLFNDSSVCKTLVNEQKQILSITDAIQWKTELEKPDKLRTYKQYKCELQKENILHCHFQETTVEHCLDIGLVHSHSL